MKTAPIPKNEMQRIQQLLSYEILDTTPEDEYNYITTLASFITKAPICLISLIDTNRQWFKSCYGIDNLKETDRSVSFCSHAINQSDIFIIENALLDERFKNNPLVSGEAHVRFYAGVPLIDSAGMALGTLCVINTEPGVLSADQIIQLKMLASQVIKLMELRKANLQIQKDYSEMSILSSKYINQQKQLEEALDNAAKLSAIGEIAASIAHEIRNPLHIVGMESELLASLSESKQSPLEESVFSSITNIDQALDRINGIIKGLTINSRLVKDEFQNVEIKSVIDDCL
jgi:signal transduction histidine kinase